MDLWLSIALIIGTLAIYMVSVEIYTALFSITGLTVQKARFQVVSLFTNAGFTTIESEIITTNKTRKRIAVFCMINGNLFTCLIIGLITNMMLNLNKGAQHESSMTIFYISTAVLAFCFFLRIPIINRYEQKILEQLAKVLFNRTDKKNIITIIDNYDADIITEVVINTMPNELKDKELREIAFKKNYDCNILMIKRKERSIEVSASTVLEKKDHVIFFGNKKQIYRLFNKTESNVDEEVQGNKISIMDYFDDKVMAQVELKEIPLILQNKTLFESGIKDQFDINVIIIKRDGKSIDVTKDTMFNIDDKIVLYGKSKAIKDLFSIK